MLKAEQITKRYFRDTGNANYFDAVKPVSAEFAPGTLTVITGRSGSGKTTFLHMMAGLLKPDGGRVTLDGTDLYALEDAALSKFRGTRIGVIPQGRSLIGTLTVKENVLLPASFSGKADAADEALKWMRMLGIASLSDAMPAGLSGGELRRAAIARTLTQGTPVILADEPTGDLDDENTRLVLSVLQDAAKKEGRTVMLVTHETEAMQFCDRAYRMREGSLTDYESEV